MKMYEHYEVKDRVIWNHTNHIKMYEPFHVWINHINHMWHDMSRHGWVVLTHVRFFEAMQAGADRLCFCQSVMEHTHTHAHAHTHTHTHTHTHIYTYIHTRIHTHADTHIHTHVHNFTHTHAHTRTHTQTHTHTLLRQKFCVSYSLWERVSVKCVVCPSLDLMAFFFLFFVWNVCVPLYLCDGICEQALCVPISSCSGTAYYTEVSFLHSQISLDDLLLQVSFGMVRWKKTKEIEIGDCN